jgi:hypothetical protein
VFARIRQYVLLALLLIIPIQAMAAVLHSISCAPQADRGGVSSALEHADAGVHVHAGHHDGKSHKHGDNSSGGSGEHTQHQCCHHMSAAPASSGTAATTDLPVFQSSVTLLELSFILEQPQRPPRA